MTTIVFNKHGMGDAPSELSHLLAKNYLKLISEELELPTYICFYAEGVKLTTEGSAVLEELKKLESMGIHLLICKTCLGFYDLLDKVEVGTVATMMDIMGAQNTSSKVITL